MIILPEDKEIMSYLSDEDAKLVLLAIFSEPDDEPELSVAARIAYSVVRNKSERISKKQSENGRKGGRPPKPTETQDNPNKPSVSVSVSDTVSDNIPAAVVARADAQENADAFPAVAAHYAEIIGSFIPPQASAEMQGYLDHMEPAVIVDAIDRAAAENNRKWSYVNGILRSRKVAGVKNMADVAREDEEHRAARADKAKSNGWPGGVGRKAASTSASQAPGKRAPDVAELERMEKFLKQLQEEDTS